MAEQAKPPIVERMLADRTLIAATRNVNESLTMFSGWLMIGVGSAFSLVVANVEKIAQFIYVSQVKVALLLLLVALALSDVVRLLSAMVSAAVSAHDSGALIAKEVEQAGKPINVDLFIEEYLRGLFWPIRWIANTSMKKVKAGDMAVSARMVSKLSQIVTLLVIIQSALIIAAAGVLVAGLKVQ